MEQQDIPSVLGALADGPILTTHRKRMDAILKHFHAAGLTLETCADKQHMNRSVTTLQKYARRLGLVFPDYHPQALRPKKEKKPKKSKGTEQ